MVRDLFMITRRSGETSAVEKTTKLQMVSCLVAHQIIICVHLMCKNTLSFENPKHLERFREPKTHEPGPETSIRFATCREFSAVAQLHRSSRQGPRHDPRAMDRAVP